MAANAVLCFLWQEPLRIYSQKSSEFSASLFKSSYETDPRNGYTMRISSIRYRDNTFDMYF